MGVAAPREVIDQVEAGFLIGGKELVDLGNAIFEEAVTEHLVFIAGPGGIGEGCTHRRVGRKRMLLPLTIVLGCRILTVDEHLALVSGIRRHLLPPLHRLLAGGHRAFLGKDHMALIAGKARADVFEALVLIIDDEDAFISKTGQENIIGDVFGEGHGK